MEVNGQQSRVKILGVKIDKDGNPVISKEEAIRLWNNLSKEVKIYCKEKYSLDLEI